MFVLNNTPNDFILIFCFIACGYCGQAYNGANSVFCRIEVPDMDRCVNNAARILALEKKLKSYMVVEYQGKAYKILAITCVSWFFVLLFCAMYMHKIGVAILKIPWEGGDFIPSTLGYSAVIMVLFNALAWPEMRESIEDQPMRARK